MHTEFWWGNMKEGGHLEKKYRADGKIILKCIVKE
jgi:hypothetical protein